MRSSFGKQRVSLFFFLSACLFFKTRFGLSRFWSAKQQQKPVERTKAGEALCRQRLGESRGQRGERGQRTNSEIRPSDQRLSQKKKKKHSFLSFCLHSSLSLPSAALPPLFLFPPFCASARLRNGAFAKLRACGLSFSRACPEEEAKNVLPHALCCSPSQLVALSQPSKRENSLCSLVPSSSPSFLLSTITPHTAYRDGGAIQHPGQREAGRAR